MVSLDEYRIQLIERVRNALSAGHVRSVLAAADLVLRAQFDRSIQAGFWEGVGADLEVIAQEVPLLLDKRALAALQPVLVAALVCTAQYRRAAGGMSGSGNPV